MTLPLVTVVIPALDEAEDIEGCLAAIAAQDYPVNRMEILVVDGASGDGTGAVARAALSRSGFGSTAVLVNPDATTPSNLNRGLAHATGEILCRVDARTRVEPHYVRSCVEVLQSRPEVAVVGGSQVAIARDGTAKAQGIARALNNRLTMGGSRYRRSTVSGPSDTVYLGAFRVMDLNTIGGWDERLSTNQDYDVNRRMEALGEVWFEASLRSGYLPRKTVRGLWEQYERFGRWKVRYWRLRSVAPSRRQRLLLAAPPLAAMVLAPILVRRPKAGLAVASITVLGLDQMGTGSPATPFVRLYAGLSMMVVALAWWSGVLRELPRA